MRIWALASCGGLLALAACSAEQSNTPDLSTAPPDSDDAAQVTARPRATASSPTARPDVRSGQSAPNRARLSPSVASPPTTALQPSSPSQLRERVQRLRAQHGSRLAPSTPLTTTPAPQVTNTPLYTSLQPPTPQAAQPLPSASDVSGANSTPDTFGENFSENFSESVTGRLENAPRSVSAAQPPTALPTSPTAPPALSAPLDDTNPNPGPVATANAARSYPTAPLRHQGHSDRSQGQRVVLTAPAAPEFTVASVHGGSSAAAIAPPEVATDPAEPTEVTATPEASPVAALNAATLSAEVSPSPEASAAHRSSASAALTLARQSKGETPDGGAGAHQSRGTEPDLAAASRATAQSRATSRPAPAAIADRPARPIARPETESLPLSPAAPPLSSPSPETNSTQGDPEVSATPPEASLTHVQAAPETLRLAIPDENPKNLIAAHCLTTGGVPLPLAGEAQGSTSPLPKFSSSNQAEFSLDLGVNPDKAELAELTATLCQEASSPAPVHESTQEPALIAN